MDKRLTLARLANKVDWEGGILEAIEYGVTREHIADPEVAELWGRLEALYSEMTPAIGRLNRLMRVARARSVPTP